MLAFPKLLLEPLDAAAVEILKLSWPPTFLELLFSLLPGMPLRAEFPPVKPRELPALDGGIYY